MQLILDRMIDPAGRAVEIVERKGLGHPDTICDAVAEAVSRALCRAYVAHYGAILHHNVDKVLLVGGRSEAGFSGGRVLEPIELTVAGRASPGPGDAPLPVQEIAHAAASETLAALVPGLDLARDLRLRLRLRPGSADLTELFLRQARTGQWHANDSSAGCGYAPLSAVERAVLALCPRTPAPLDPAAGPDVKVMACRAGATVSVTVAAAMLAHAVPDIAAYRAAKARIAARATACFADAGAPAADVAVNAADDEAAGSVYLTATGSSAEAGDDGECGRGNRANGLIAVGRPMTMEAVAGKNPVSHVGKLYNIAAFRIAETLVAALPEVAAAECRLVSRIGRPVADPALASVSLALRDDRPAEAMGDAAQEILYAELAGLAGIWRDFAAGAIATF